MFKSDRMEISEDEMPKPDVEFRELDCIDSKSSGMLADIKLECPEAEQLYDCEEALVKNEPEEYMEEPSEVEIDDELFVPEPLYRNEKEIDELKNEELQSVVPKSEEMLAPSEVHSEEEQPLGASEGIAESKDQIDDFPACTRWRNGRCSMIKRGKGNGKNPFIRFFLSMQSRRPKQRVTDVARQAGRQWARMSDSQRKLYYTKQQQKQFHLPASSIDQ